MKPQVYPTETPGFPYANFQPLQGLHIMSVFFKVTTTIPLPKIQKTSLSVWLIRGKSVTLQAHIIIVDKIMATLVLQVPDENLVSKVKQACKMLVGVASVKVQKSTPKVDDITKTAHYKAAMDDVKNGRVYHADSVDDMFNQILG